MHESWSLISNLRYSEDRYATRPENWPGWDMHNEWLAVRNRSFPRALPSHAGLCKNSRRRHRYY